MGEEQKQVKEEQQKAKKTKFDYSFLKDYENAPTQEQLENWKELYNKIYLASLSEDELYIFRRISRLEFKNIQRELQKAVQAGSNVDDSWMEDQVVRHCLLFPEVTPEFKTASPAGTIPSLYKQIMMVSNFLDDNVLMRLVMEI